MTTPTRKPEYTMFVDESGHAGITGAMRDANDRYLCLVGIIVRNDIVKKQLRPKIDALKTKYIGKSYVPFHVTDMIRRRKSFSFLHAPSKRQDFFSDLSDVLRDFEHTVVCALIDKQELIRVYKDKAREPYRFAMQIILERFALFLDEKSATGKVVAESRNTNVDIALNETFKFYWQYKGAFNKSRNIAIKSVISSKNIKFYKKSKCVAGIEVADLYAYSLKAWGIANYPDIAKAYPPLRPPADFLLEICLKQKIRRISGGFIGCGYKMWPQNVKRGTVF